MGICLHCVASTVHVATLCAFFQTIFFLLSVWRLLQKLMNHLTSNVSCSDWLRWFKLFCIASGLNGDSDERQISTLLYCLGEEAEAVLTSTNPMADNKKYDEILGKFDDF